MSQIYEELYVVLIMGKYYLDLGLKLGHKFTNKCALFQKVWKKIF